MVLSFQKAVFVQTLVTSCVRAVPVVFSLQKALSAGDGLQFVDRLASSLKIDSARVQLDGAQFDEQSEVVGALHPACRLLV